MIVLSQLTSCTAGFEEMNVNPTTPVGTEIPYLFTNVISSLRVNGNEQLYVYNEIFYPESELGALIAEGWSNYTIGTAVMWSSYYSSLANVRDIEQRLDDYCSEQNDSEICDNVKAMLLILTAYKTFKVTDVFGDIPFSQAGKVWLETNNEEYRKPKFDSQEDIYKSLLDSLVWARDFMTANAATTTLGNDFYPITSADVLFYGSADKWARFANSLILRHGLRMYDADPDFAKPLLVEAYNKPVIDEDDYYPGYGGVCLWPNTLGITFDHHWAFREHKNLRMGETVFSRLSTTDSTDGSGIFDYRTYVFFDTNHPIKSDTLCPQGRWVPYPQIRTSSTPAEGGSPYGYRDNNYYFKSPLCLFSSFNYYLIRDDAYVPEILMTAAEIGFVKAEILARGIVGEANSNDVGLAFQNAMESSFLFWIHLPGYVNRWTYYYTPLEEALASMDIYSLCTKFSSDVFNHYLEQNGWNLFTNEEYVKLIVEQRWLNSFLQPWEAWILARRTLGSDYETPTTTGHSKLITYRLPYPSSENEYNHENYQEQVAKMAPLGDSKSTKVWWMN